EIGFGFNAFSQFSRKSFKFLFVHNLPVSVSGVNISKTGNYTILITVSKAKIPAVCVNGHRDMLISVPPPDG
ncbi:MAG TPA: hypothetical protein VH187_16540, partial [Scandinavium sp.]|nr:hypothetical protein [Scandinavium sp.]